MNKLGRVLWYASLLGAVLGGVPHRLRRRFSRKTEQRSLRSGGRKRTYDLHVPSGLAAAEPAPLVLVFHGGFTDGAFMEELTGFNAVADRERFLVAYPNGVGKHWNDGRTSAGSRAQREQVDDVGFVGDLLEDIGRDHPVDPRRVFATGLSNGAAFAHYLAARLARRIAAIAPVVGGIAEEFAPLFRPEAPVSVCIIQGTGDPLVPWGGGPINLPGKRGATVSTEAAIQLWVESNGCVPEPAVRNHSVYDSPGDCRVRESRWSGGREGSEVVYYAVEGGGHTWPGGPQYLPERIVGRVCKGFNATEVIWQFFKAHAKP